MEAQIHQLEQEAYSAVLRAFKAQSDALTWVYMHSHFLPHQLYILSSYYPALKVCLLYFMYIHQEKEGLITELRKELRVSDDEHRELLTRVNADEIIYLIRYLLIISFKSCNAVATEI